MTKKKIIKCHQCGKTVDRLSCADDGNKKFHEECYSKYLNSGNTSANFIELTDYINQVYVLPTNLNKADYKSTWVEAGAVISIMHKKDNLTYVGMRLTLQYMIKVLQKEFNGVEFIGLIPFNYHRARVYFMEQKKAEKYAEAIDINYYMGLERVVYAKIQELEPALDLQPVDISSIEVDDELDDIWDWEDT